MAAKQWKQDNPDSKMQLTADSTILFGIAPESRGMGTIKPSNKKFRLKKSFL
jgi:hypothetical protein